jgi:hypothetical protein
VPNNIKPIPEAFGKTNLNIALAEIDKIVVQYNVDLSDAQKGKKGKVEKPVLIISESFI